MDKMPRYEPIYEIIGKGIKTGRKRKRTYVAQNEEEARNKALDDETTVESIEKLLPMPAEKFHLQYARDNNLNIPDNPTYEQMYFVYLGHRYKIKNPGDLTEDELKYCVSYKRSEESRREKTTELDIPDLPNKLTITSSFEDGFVKNEKYNQLIEDQFGSSETGKGSHNKVIDNEILSFDFRLRNIDGI
jgi:hypothetical protein